MKTVQYILGVLFIGDPAQLLPIGSEPLWSIRSKTDRGKPCTDDSLFGIISFRELFGLKPLEKVKNYELWKKYEKTIRKTKSMRKDMANFTFEAMLGTYDVVYLKEVRRSVDGDDESEFLIKTMIPKVRYGKIDEDDIRTFRSIFATKEKMIKDREFLDARNSIFYH